MQKILYILGFISLLSNPSIAFQSEIQWSLCESKIKSIFKKLDIEAIYAKGKIKELSLYDLPSLDFQNQGITFRIKKGQKSNKVTVKVKFSSPDEVNWSALAKVPHRCEWDRYRDQRRFTCNLNHETEGAAFFQRDQLKVLKSLKSVSADEAELAAMLEWGPFVMEEWKFDKETPMSLEVVTLPDGEKLVELSTRVESEDEEVAFKDLTNWLLNSQIDLCDHQSGRTHEILRRVAPHQKQDYRGKGSL